MGMRATTTSFFIGTYWLLATLCFIGLTSVALGQAPKAPPPQPLIFYYDKEETVRIIWNPNMNIKSILEVAQREVSYQFDKDTGGPKPVYQKWRVLVREQDGHDASRRYAFVKDDHCRAVQFKLGWKTNDGKEYKDIIQTLEPMPIAKDLGSSITVKPAKLVDQKVKVALDFSADLSKYESIKVGEVSADIELEKCDTLFPKPAEAPKVSAQGKIITFDPRYAIHGCQFKVNLMLPTFDKKTDCLATYKTSKKESTVIKLSCKSTEGLECPPAKYNCKMNCSPKLSSKPYFELDGNDTLAYSEASWSFDGPSPKDLKGVVVHYYHSWLNHENHPFELENVTTTKVKKGDGNKVLLRMLSVTPQAMWVLQVCQLREECKDIKWKDVPAYPVWYYPYHDAHPPWHQANATAGSTPDSPETQGDNKKVPAKPKEAPKAKTGGETGGKSESKPKATPAKGGMGKSKSS